MTSLLRNVASPIVTFRFSLDTPGAVDGQQSYVNIATAESGRAENRPQLLVTIPDGREADRAHDRGAGNRGADHRSAEDDPADDGRARRRHRPRRLRPATTTPTTKPSSTASGWNLTFVRRLQRKLARHVEVELRREHVRRRQQRDRVQPSGERRRVGRHHAGRRPRRAPNVCPNETPAQRVPERPSVERRRRSTPAASSRRPKVDSRSDARMPKGQGFWPAFWLTSQNYPFGGNGASGELDVFEVFGDAERHGHVFVVVLLEQFQLFRTAPAGPAR